MPISAGCACAVVARSSATAATAPVLTISIPPLSTGLFGGLGEVPYRRLLALAEPLAFLVDELARHRDRRAILHVDELPVDHLAVAERLLGAGEVELPHAVEHLV